MIQEVSFLGNCYHGIEGGCSCSYKDAVNSSNEMWYMLIAVDNVMYMGTVNKTWYWLLV